MTGQTAEEPVIGSGVAGTTVLIVTGNDCTLLVPHELVADTVMFPAVAPADVDTVIEFVPAPAVILHPEGTVQL